MKEDNVRKNIEIIATRLVEQVRDACKTNREKVANSQTKDESGK
ncbi:MAG: hypothetical protein UV78_C0001G0008 [Parcubacteria group bacterium GW2011_GWA2_43_17]|nr:MAG: hypothetical protein UV78_C0001G0008 [Parcubacteria group bacterium GW2011_GWA2_43_17]